MGEDKSRSKRKQRPPDGRHAVIDLLLQMEPELKQLQGGITILRALGETADSVEPIALAALAQNCGTSFDRVMELWKATVIAARR